MSATPLSLREARQREAEAEDVATKNYALVNATDYEKLLAARRATDEALLAAFLKWFARQPFVELERLGLHGYERAPDWSAVLDAVEREEAGR